LFQVAGAGILGRAIGWGFFGLVIGLAAGITSGAQLWKGMLGGVMGGLVGGILLEAQVVQKVGSPKKLDGAFLEVDALASVDGEIPW
jgi:hypothetical protein